MNLAFLPFPFPPPPYAYLQEKLDYVTTDGADLWSLGDGYSSSYEEPAMATGAEVD